MERSNSARAEREGACVLREENHCGSRQYITRLARILAGDGTERQLDKWTQTNNKRPTTDSIPLQVLSPYVGVQHKVVKQKRIAKPHRHA
jgi:hypothetical protein